MFTGDLKWDRAAAKAELLRTITLEEVLALLDNEMLAKDGAKRVSVCFCVCFCLLWLLFVEGERGVHMNALLVAAIGRVTPNQASGGALNTHTPYTTAF